ncbi:MAG TPA: hypothetical protein DD473_27595 [Planctomycetaceae bacterium]|nr:hypothetical protein [Planctomycetaceae bacterium]
MKWEEVCESKIYAAALNCFPQFKRNAPAIKHADLQLQILPNRQIWTLELIIQLGIRIRVLTIKMISMISR